MGAPLKVLMVEDSADDAEMLVRELRRGGFDLAWKRVETEDALRAALEDDAWDVVTANYEMPRLNAHKALEVLKEYGRDVPFIVVSGAISMERTAELMRAGAHDVVEKNNLARLVPAIEQGLQGAAEHPGRKRTEELLEDAIENMADGFALFDAEDRFVLCNENYRNILWGIADHLRPGTSFEDMTRAFAERGLIAVEADQIDDWVRTRVPQHRAAKGFHEHNFSDGRWIRSAERRTSDGGLVCIRTDITEFMRAEPRIEPLALRDGLTNRQAQVLQKLASGHTNKEIAEHLGLSIYTVRCHVSAVFRALDVSNRTQAALIAKDLLQ